MKKQSYQRCPVRVCVCVCLCLCLSVCVSVCVCDRPNKPMPLSVSVCVCDRPNERACSEGLSKSRSFQLQLDHN